MKNIRDIFTENAASTKNRENAGTGQHEDGAASDAQSPDNGNGRKRFCPVCYMNYEVTTNVCPECGTQMEEPMTEEEEAELMEVLFCTRS